MNVPPCEYCRQPVRFCAWATGATDAREHRTCSLHLGDVLTEDRSENQTTEWKVVPC